MGGSLFCARHYRLLATLTLVLAAFNLGFRLDREVVTSWDEALYATSAAEMVKGGDWLVTTYGGTTDYYNAKPPLNVWLIASAFNLFGFNLIALRLASVVGAWVTIALLQWWARRLFGPVAALLASLVLSTTFGFVYVHSARSGNPDALFALTVLLTVVTLWSARDRPARLIWIGPIAAAAFMLKGTAVLLPLLIVVGFLAWNRPRTLRVSVVATAALLFAVPVGAWAIARWNADGIWFFRTLLQYDLVERTSGPIEGHDGSVLFYFHQLQKDQYDWLAVGLAAIAVLAASGGLRRWAMEQSTRRLLTVWAVVTLAVPTLMSTKLPWYINPMFPLLALVVAGLVSSAITQSAALRSSGPRVALVAVVLFAFCLAEGKLLWYSYSKRDLDETLQGLLLSHREEIAGSVVAQRVPWDPADRFVLEHLVNGRPEVAAQWPSAPGTGTCWMVEQTAKGEALALIETGGRRHVAPRGAHRRVERIWEAARHLGRRLRHRSAVVTAAPTV